MRSTTTAEAKAALRRTLTARPLPEWGPLLSAFLNLPEVAEARTLLLFYGVGREPDTRPLVEALLSRGKRVALPRCLPAHQMEARSVTRLEKLQPGAFQIPEPGEDCPLMERGELDLILTPCLCCDKEGYRLGHGAGYYDRYLTGYAGRTVALCPSIWLQEKLPRDAFDIPVGLVLTELEQWRGGVPHAAAQEKSAAK